MANLMITTYCNFTCRYCFGLDMIGPEHAKTHMSWETFLNLLALDRQVRNGSSQRSSYGW